MAALESSLVSTLTVTEDFCSALSFSFGWGVFVGVPLESSIGIGLPSSTFFVFFLEGLCLGCVGGEFAASRLGLRVVSLGMSGLGSLLSSESIIVGSVTSVLSFG